MRPAATLVVNGIGLLSGRSMSLMRYLGSLSRDDFPSGRTRQRYAGPEGDAVDLYWLPLGAGGHFVRLNGRVFEAVAARLPGRRARASACTRATSSSNANGLGR